MPLANREAEAQGVRRQLMNGGNVLVVGARSTNFSSRIREHPRIVVWDSTNAQIETRTPPENTRVIICLRFISHSIFARLFRYARKKHLLMMPGLSSTGEVREVLEIALNIEPEVARAAIAELADDEHTPAPIAAPEEPEPMHAKKTVHRPRGAMRQYIASQVNWDAPPAQEAKRLFAVAQANGFPDTTESAVAQTVYVLRKERREAAGEAAHAPRHAPTPQQPRSQPHTETPPPPPSTRRSNVDEALRLIDEAGAVLGLVREAVQKVAHDDQATQQTVAELQGYLTRLGMGPKNPNAEVARTTH